MAVVAWALGLLVGEPPLQGFRWDAKDAGLGLVASLPLLVVAWSALRLPWPPLARIRRFFDDLVRPFFEPCTAADLGLISACAGIGEEMLFRGLLQGGLSGWLGPWAGLCLASACFGLAHLITPTYAIIAGLIGAYLGGLWIATGNLLAPIVAHAAYDLVALIYLLRIRREAPDAAAEGGGKSAPHVTGNGTDLGP